MTKKANITIFNQMVEYSDIHNQKLDRIFHALADTTRRQILDQLLTEPCRISGLVEAHHLSFNAVSKHVKVLEGSGLLNRKIEGRVHTCSVDAEQLQEVEKWLMVYRRFWDQRLDALERYLKEK